MHVSKTNAAVSQFVEIGCFALWVTKSAERGVEVVRDDKKDVRF